MPSRGLGVHSTNCFTILPINEDFKSGQQSAFACKISFITVNLILCQSLCRYPGILDEISFASVGVRVIGTHMLI